MLLTQDQEMIRDAVRDFAQTELWPNAARWDKEHYFPREAHQGLAALGAYGICVPEEFGGANLDYLTLALVLEEIAAGDGGTSTAGAGLVRNPACYFKPKQALALCWCARAAMNSGVHSSSMAMAVASPPPMHSVASPFFRPRACRA